jgi:hypothetical protein
MEKPIIFSTEMIRAILKGQKTQTRRVIKPQPPDYVDRLCGPGLYEPAIVNKNGELAPGEPVYGIYDEWGEWGVKCPYGQPGDTLWVRETWNTSENVRPPINDPFIYRADFNEYGITKWDTKWKPSIHMPREAARIFLRVNNIRVEKLQDITEADARVEGILAINGFLLDHSSEWCKYTVMAAATQGRDRPGVADSIGGFAYIWDRINAKRGYGWRTNPWVWVIEFEIAHSNHYV